MSAPPVVSTMGTHALTRLEEAFAAAHSAQDEVMHAIAQLCSAGEGLDRRELAWLVEQSKVLANRGDRIRSRSMGVLQQMRETGRSLHTDDAQFAGRASRTDGHDTSRDRKLADALGNLLPPGEATPQTEPIPQSGHPEGQEHPRGPRYPRTAAIFDRGLISERHAVIIVDTLDELPEGLVPEERARVEEHLLEQAQRLSPSRLRIEARRALEALDVAREVVDEHENDQVLAEEQAALDKASFWMKDNHDGTWFGQFTLPELQALMLKKQIETTSSPRRRENRARGGESADALHRSLERRNEQGRALAEIIDHLPGDHLSTKTNAILLVRTDLETLRGETDRAGVTEAGAVVSAQQVRRLASQAGIVPAVMGGEGQLIDLGQQRRAYSDVQRKALALRYSTCAEEDCDRPFAWTEIHHADPWAPVRGPDGTILHPGGGRTDLDNGIPLCGRHHRLLDDRRRTHTIERDELGVATVRFQWRKDFSRW